MKKFSRDAGRLSKETNLTMSEVLKCFDVIPILYNEYNSEIPPVISGRPVDYSDVDTIKYIGGYIVRKCLKKRSTSDIEKKFLRQCVVDNMESSLCEIVEPLVKILVQCEIIFREKTIQSMNSINLNELWKTLEETDILSSTERLTATQDLDYTRNHCLRKIISLYFKIRGHRFAVKMANEKETHRVTAAGSRTLRKSLKKNCDVDSR